MSVTSPFLDVALTPLDLTIEPSGYLNNNKAMIHQNACSRWLSSTRKEETNNMKLTCLMCVFLFLLFCFSFNCMCYQLLCVKHSCSSTQSWGSVLPSIVNT